MSSTSSSSTRASSSNSCSTSSSNACSTSSSNSSSTSPSSSNSPSTSTSSTTNPGSSSTSSMSTSRTSRTSTSGTSSSSRNTGTCNTSSSSVSSSRVSSSCSSTPKAGAMNKPLAQLLRRERLRPGRQPALALVALELEELELLTLELEVLALGVLCLAVQVLEALCGHDRFLFPCFARFLLQPASPLPAPSPYTEQIDSPLERREPASLRVLLHIAAHRDYELHSLDFSTVFFQGSLHDEIRLRRPPGFTGSFPAGTQWSLRRSVYGLRQAPHEWHNTLRTTLVVLGYAPSSADPSLFLRTDTSLLPFCVLVYVHDLVFATADTEALTLVKSELQKRHTCTDMVLQHFGFQFSLPQPTPLSTDHSLSAPPSDESVELSGPYPELVGCLITSGMGLVLGGRVQVVLTGHADASWADGLATQWSSSCGAEIYARAMAAQELHWLTYLLTDLGEQPRSPPHIALRYFLARGLQQRGQLRLAYVATKANTANISTKALQPGDHQRFSTI
ncbi:unnamed protein product [Closterium sp. NIES-53]